MLPLWINICYETPSKKHKDTKICVTDPTSFLVIEL